MEEEDETKRRREVEEEEKARILNITLNNFHTCKALSSSVTCF